MSGLFDSSGAPVALPEGGAEEGLSCPWLFFRKYILCIVNLASQHHPQYLLPQNGKKNKFLGVFHESQGRVSGQPTKTDEFSEKFQTAFDPPSFSENHIADSLQRLWSL